MVGVEEAAAEGGSGLFLCPCPEKTAAKMFRHVLAFRQVARRGVSNSVRRDMKNTVPEKQKLFQEDNGLPVHLKGGTSDVLLYRATMMLTVVGTGYVLYELWSAAFPKKKE